MFIKLKKTLFFVLLISGCLINAQGVFNLSSEKTSKIKFQLINNVIVVPVELNGIKLSFVLDTGVSRPILFNLVNMDSLLIKNTEKSFLRGLGNQGNIAAIKSKGNIIKIGEAIAVNKEIAVVFDETINFTPRLGVNVHGIIGYDIFKDFIVELNYSSKYIRLHVPRFFNLKKVKKWTETKIEVIDKKPYLNASTIINSKQIPLKLLMDTGNSDALWLFENSNQNIKRPTTNYFDDFLGKGLSGAVYGVRSKVDNFSIESYVLENVNTAYPDSASLGIVKKFKARNGSVSGNILKRFNMFFDYDNSRLWLKKNRNFKDPFYYNNSGVVIEQHGFRVVKEAIKNKSYDSYRANEIEGAKSIDVLTRYRYELKPSYEIVELRPNSNAKTAGLKIGDVIVAINGNQTSKLSLQQVNSFLFNKKGKLLRITVNRFGEDIRYRFKLDDVFKTKSPSK